MNSLEQKLTLITAHDGEVLVSFIKRNYEPYKNLFELPKKEFKGNVSLEKNMELLINEIGMKNVFFTNHHTYYEDKVLTINYLGIVDYGSREYLQEENDLDWFSIELLPKLAFNDYKIVTDALEFLKDKIIDTKTLFKLFPNDFTIPELQKTIETIIGTSFDRRNFRKKLMALDLLIDTKNINESGIGRPAKLYKFNKEKEIKILF